MLIEALQVQQLLNETLFFILTLQPSLMWRCSSCLQHFLLPFPPNWKWKWPCRPLNLIADEEQLLLKLFREVPLQADSNELARLELHSCKLSSFLSLHPTWKLQLAPHQKWFYPAVFTRNFPLPLRTWGEDEQLKEITSTNHQAATDVLLQDIFAKEKSAALNFLTELRVIYV